MFVTVKPSSAIGSPPAFSSSSSAPLTCFHKRVFFTSIFDANRTAWNGIVTDRVYSAQGLQGQTLQSCAKTLQEFFFDNFHCTAVVEELKRIYVDVALQSQIL